MAATVERNLNNKMKTESSNGLEQSALAAAPLLAGLSINTIFQLKNAPDEAIAILPNGPGENGKYSAWLMIGVADKIRPLLSTKPIFDTPESAVGKMKDVLKATREIDLIGKPANKQLK